MPKQKPNLFEFAAAIMAEPGTGAAKIVGCQIGYAGLPGTPLDCILDYVRCHARSLQHSSFQNPPEYFSVTYSRMAEPCIEKLLGP